MMTRTRLSRRYQATISRNLREGFHPEQNLTVMRKGNIILLVVDRPMSAFRGILKGVPTTGFREKNDRQF